MRVRHALIGLALGSALAVGGTATTAQAAVPAASAKSSAAAANAADSPSLHWVGIYPTQAECQAAAEAVGSEQYTCGFINFDTLWRGWVLNAWY
ncbi:hypothetical protein AB0F18_07945 [Streptomyces sp. NPDC029216]|uniref:hypothetical protein n=1 Tax=Streptomyces sp. NPDC029216 TaxID=3154701 RepID=UPI0033F32161